MRYREAVQGKNDTRSTHVERAARDHLEFQRLIIEISSQFIDASPSQVDDRIVHALASLAHFVGADRAYVFLLHDRGRLADNTHEWCSPRAEPQAHRLQDLELDVVLPWFAKLMRGHQVMHVPRVADLPPEAAAERMEFQAENIRSLVVVPMVHGGKLAGFLGFDAVGEERQWSSDAVVLLRIVGQMVISVLERARVERALAKSEDRFRSLVESTSDLVWEIDAQGVYTYVSPKIRDVVGLEPHEVLGRSAFELMWPDDATRARIAFQRQSSLKRAIHNVESRLRHRDGHDVWVETSGVPLVDERGTLLGYRGIDRDVTARKRGELERQALDQRLRESHRLESLGLLAGGIAHDFNNLLTAVLGQASLTRLVLPPDHKAQESLGLISQAALRAAELTRQLLAYSGRGTFVRSVVDLSSIAREMGPLLEASTSTKGLLHWNLRDDLPAVEGDVSQFRQIIMNLVINACDAVTDRESARVDITTGLTPLHGAELDKTFFEPGFEGREVVYLEVTDNGPGIGPEVVQRMFDPFFSTKSVSRGLGLSAVLGILRAHQGGLLVRTSPAEGTCFRILLPVATKPLSLQKESSVPESRPAPGQGCVLVIDDDGLVRSAAAMILQGHGYQVLQAPDGESGIRTFDTRATDIDVVLLDMTMPGLNGAQVAERLRTIRPEVRILVASGFPSEETAAKMGLNPPQGYLQKPYSAGSLVEAVEKVRWRGV